MQFKIWNIIVTIQYIKNEPARERRKMAKLVEENTSNVSGATLFIQRVKAYRLLSDEYVGLKDAADWVKSAFADGGKGVIL